MVGQPRVQIIWKSREVLDEVKRGVNIRLKKAAEHVQNSVVLNISQPVTKVRKKRRRNTSRGKKGSSYTYTLPESRSKPGQFPKAETSHLRRNVFKRFVQVEDGIVAHVGTTLFYGMILEVFWDRSYLVRTFLEETPTIRKILLTPGKESPAFTFTVAR